MSSLRKLALGNSDYVNHMTDEGDQLQRGLEHVGWVLAGAGFTDSDQSVDSLLERHRPDLVFVHDRRDWSPDSAGCFRQGIEFRNLESLHQRPEILVACVLKDAGSVQQYHQRYFEEARADAAVIYYHPSIVRALNPWLDERTLVRTYHSVDRTICDSIPWVSKAERKYTAVSGALSGVYPLRNAFAMWARRYPKFSIDVLPHPGYSNTGSHTVRYLETLGQYKVHVATASKFGFALRKIFESVAMGCTPVTNLPATDILPEIDGALVRVDPKTRTASLLFSAVKHAAAKWDEGERKEWAEKARAYYDFRASGIRLDADLVAAYEAKQKRMEVR